MENTRWLEQNLFEAYNIRPSLRRYSFTSDNGSGIKLLLNSETSSSMLNLSMEVATFIEVLIVQIAREMASVINTENITYGENSSNR